MAGITMNIKRIIAAVAAAVTLTVIATACTQPEGGGSPFETNPSIPLKLQYTNESPVAMICHVDTEQYNPLNAKDYFFQYRDGNNIVELPFFDYVVLAHAWLVKDSRGYTRIELSPSLKHILDNSVTYIKPLHQKGIKVLIELRSGNFDDNADEGQSTGLGTMDMAGIEEFIIELDLLINHYGIDGFDYNDRGGGKNAYPPYSRNLKQFRSDEPLYPDELFIDPKTRQEYSEAEINAILWREGGNNLSNLIQRVNEHFRETWTMDLPLDANPESVVQTLSRKFLVRNVNYGGQLLSSLRMEYMPDAYTGADPKVLGNLQYVIHDNPLVLDDTSDPPSYINPKPHASIFDEKPEGSEDVGAASDDRYAPFAVDLRSSARLSRVDAERWGNTFLLKDPDGNAAAPANQNRYGALYFTNLESVSQTVNAGGTSTAAYLTYFSRALFKLNTELAKTEGAGDW